MEAVEKYNSSISHSGVTPREVLEQIQMIQSLMKTAMKDGEHYGIIPGTQKPTLYKAGAEKLSLMFRLAPKYVIEKTVLQNGHREYECLCKIRHIDSGKYWGEGVGVCSTMESKFRYRNAARVCPECEKETIIKGKKEYGGGWICFTKKGGCGAKFGDEDQAIIGQSEGRVENPDLADLYNTVKKMGKKRAFVDAMLTATAASDIFTQDLEELPIEKKLIEGGIPEPKEKAKEEKPKRDYDEYFKLCKNADEIMKKYLALPGEEKGKGTVAYLEAQSRKEFSVLTKSCGSYARN